MEIQHFLRTAIPVVLICGFFASASAATPVKNYLRDTGFMNKNGEWKLTVSKIGSTAGFKELPPQNGYCFQIENPVPSGHIQLHQKLVMVPEQADCFFSFDLEAEQGSQNWFTVKIHDGGFLYHKSSPVKKGKQHFEFSFFSPSSKNGMVPLDVNFSLASLKGKNRISNPQIIALLKKDILPNLLSPKWNVKQAEKSFTADFSKKAFQFRERTKAVFSNEFTSKESGMMRFGISATGSFKVYCNGELRKEEENAKHGWRGELNDHRMYLPVREGKNTVTIEFEGTDLRCGDPGELVHFCENTGFRPVVNDRDLYVKPGSALDLSDLHRKPEEGRPVLNSDGEYVYEKSGKLVHLFGVDGGEVDKLFSLKDRKKFEKEVAEYVDAMKRQGYNYIRLWGTKIFRCDKAGNLAVSEEKFDRVYFLFDLLSKKGIYANWVILGSDGIYGTQEELRRERPSCNANRMLGFLQDPKIMKHWKFGIQLLAHKKNGKMLMGSPCLLSLEAYNEQYAGLALLKSIKRSHPTEFKKFESAWNRYLSEKYKKEFKNEPVPFNDGKYRNDFALFQEKLVTDTNLRYVHDLRKIGWKGMIFQNSYRNLLYRSAVWKTLEGVNDHSYFNHPSAYTNIGSITRNNSSIEVGLNYVRDITSAAFAGRPVFVGEINHSFWNPYLYECGAVLGAFASLHGFSGYNFFASNVIRNAYYGFTRIACFDIAANPISNASAFLQAHLYGRGDVRRSPHIVTLQIPNSFLFSNANALQSSSTEQSLLSLVTRFTVGFPELPLPDGVALGRKPDMELKPTGLATITDHGWFASINETKDQKFSLEKAVEELRRRKVLSPKNRTDVKKGIFESDTEEILLRRKEKQLVIRTPRTEVFVSPAGKSETIDALKVVNSTVDSCFAAVSRDGKPLSESRHIVLVYTTQSANQDMRLSADQQVMCFPGLLPVVLKTGKVTAELRNDSADLVCYALSLNGTRLEKIPLKKKNDVWHIEIDTAKLKQEPSVYFELTEEKKK